MKKFIEDADSLSFMNEICVDSPDFGSNDSVNCMVVMRDNDFVSRVGGAVRLLDEEEEMQINNSDSVIVPQGLEPPTKIVSLLAAFKTVGIIANEYEVESHNVSFCRQHLNIRNVPFEFDGKVITQYYFPPVGHEIVTVRYDGVGVSDGRCVHLNGISSIIYAAREYYFNDECMIFTIRLIDGRMFSFFWGQTLYALGAVKIVRRCLLTRYKHSYYVESGEMNSDEIKQTGIVPLYQSWCSLSRNMIVKSVADAFVVLLDGNEYLLMNKPIVILDVVGNVGTDSTGETYPVENRTRLMGRCSLEFNTTTKKYRVLRMVNQPMFSSEQIYVNERRLLYSSRLLQRNIPRDSNKIDKNISVIVCFKEDLPEKWGGMLPYFVKKTGGITRNACVARAIMQTREISLNNCKSMLSDDYSICFNANLGNVLVPPLYSSVLQEGLYLVNGIVDENYRTYKINGDRYIRVVETYIRQAGYNYEEVQYMRGN